MDPKPSKTLTALDEAKSDQTDLKNKDPKKPQNTASDPEVLLVKSIEDRLANIKATQNPPHSTQELSEKKPQTGISADMQQELVPKSNVNESPTETSQTPLSPKDDEAKKPGGCVSETLTNLMENRWVVLAIFGALTAYGIITVVTDWLMFADVVRTKPGLVFGPQPTSIVGLLGTVSSIATIALVFEIFNNIKELFFGEEVVDDDLVGTISMYLQEVPQVTLSMLIAACRGTPVSVFQTIKLAVAILGAVIRLLSTLLHYFGPDEAKSNIMKGVVYTGILLASAYTVSASIATFVFLNHQQKDRVFGSSELSAKYDHGLYLNGSGIYFNHPVFNGCENMALEPKESWLKISAMYSVMESGSNGPTVRFQWTDTASRLIMTTANPPTQRFLATFPFSNVHRVNVDKHRTSESVNIVITTGSNCRCYETTLTMPDCQTAEVSCARLDVYNQSMIIRLQYVPRSQTLPLGDITFRARLQRQNLTGCLDLNVTAWGDLSTTTQTYGTIQFARRTTYYPDEGPFRNSSSFYQKRHLRNVTTAWKTGYRHCDMRGSMRPNPDNSIHLDC